MEGTHNISQYRDRLDKTLLSHDLSNVETLKTLVANQMLQPPQDEDQEYGDNLVQKRTKEVANFLSMLRSASASETEGSKTKEIPHGGWKIKQDNQDCRVMYREGPAGTPFHTLLVEGYVDGPAENCLCVSWETGLYPKWWPQFSIPTFKVVSSECLKKVRMGEQISLVRMKLSWPLSAREALVHFFTFEYFQDDLMVVLFNSISDLNNIDKSTHGFTRDGIPDEQNVTRIDLVGGLALQKVTVDRSYFRTIANLDIKLDFVPPAFINFVSRQLIGSGFKLYKKVVASVSKGDDVDYGQALKDPFYSRIREALYSDKNISNAVFDVKSEDAGVDASTQSDEHFTPEDTSTQSDEHFAPEDTEVVDQKATSEIEEVEESHRPHEENGKGLHEQLPNDIVNVCHSIDSRKKVKVSAEVEEALGTLEKVILIFREYGFNPKSLSVSGFANKVFANLEDNSTKCPKQLEAPMNELAERTARESRNSSCSRNSRHEEYISYAIETKDDKVGLASAEEDIASSCDTRQSSFSFAINDPAKSAVLEHSANGELKNADEDTLTKRKIKRHRFCCLHFNSGRQNA